MCFSNMGVSIGLKGERSGHLAEIHSEGILVSLLFDFKQNLSSRIP